MYENAFESRMLKQRAQMQTSSEELNARVNKSDYGDKAKDTLYKEIKYGSTGAVGYSLFEAPPVIVEGKGATVYDADGTQYVDMLSGFSVANVGHSHPKIINAISEQSANLIHYFDSPSP